eukprot:TRINITY_DN52870_c0_g1_i1.p1 TRINITY_DN52870_c0_g1~~TRINITY_DN52870_c0_g1_i1.p1  ORF type:complete len:304 (+),score=66.04 TRINITY_DN52870_c0_g1_i1:54-965(+)
MRPKLFPGANSISAVAAGVATILSLHLMYKHVKYYCVPAEQKHIIRILWMIPIYAVDCAIATWEPDWSKYVDPARDCYEAYVLYSFCMLLKAYLNTERSELSAKFGGAELHHLAPFCCLKPLTVNRMFFRRCEQGIIQYMLIKPLLAIIQMSLTLADLYDGGMMDYKRGYTYILLFTNLSQTLALYCLVYLYHAIHECPEMLDKNLLSKFLCIKAVVFFAFWQSCLFSFLEYLKIIEDGNNMTADVKAAGMDDFILCIEMCIIAFLHRKVCLLYTSDAADEEDSVDLGGRRINKKKNNIENTQ